jgi:hypothetical protein
MKKIIKVENFVVVEGLKPFENYLRTNINDTTEFSLKSPCLHPVFGPPFTPYPLFE